MRRQWAQGVVERAGRSPNSLVFAGCWQERRALRRMAARGDAHPCHGLPGVWRVILG